MSIDTSPSNGASVSELTSAMAQKEVVRFPWVKGIPRFNFIGIVLIYDIASPLGMPGSLTEELFWSAIDRSAARDHAEVIRQALINAGRIVAGVERELLESPHHCWTEVNPEVDEVRCAVLRGDAALKSRVTPEEHAVLVRLFGPRYSPEPAIDLTPPTRR